MAIVYGANYGRPTLDLNFARNKSLIDTVSGQNFVTFTRSSSGTYVGSDGLIKTAVANEPRFDHDPLTGECLGLLIEESRTNLRTYSSSINASNNYRIYGTAAYNTTDTTTPDGTNTATKITGNGSIFQGFDTYSNDYGSNENVTQTYSVFVKNINATSVSVGLPNGTYSFNFSTETGTGPGGFQKFSNGWYRIWNTAIKSNQFWFQGIYIDASSATTNSVYVWGAQNEVASFPTSYIPTTASTVTRTVDTASITGTNFSRWYNQSENTVFCQGISASRENSGYYTLQGSVSNGSSVLVYPANTITWQVFDTSFQVNTTLSTYNLVSSIKSAVAMKSNDFAGVINGGSIVTDNSGTVPSVTSLVIGNYLGGAATYDYTGTISRLTYYPTRLQNFQLQQLTK